MEKYYKPNIGLLFWVHLILILAVLIPILIILKFLGIATAILLIPTLLILLLIVVVSLLVVARTMYTMDDEKITIMGAFKKFDIPYETVTKIVDTNKGLVGEGMFVLSADRLVIFFGEGGKASISPRDKPDALSVLKSYCPEAEFEEDLKVKKATEETAETASEDAADTVNEETADTASEEAAETESDETAETVSEEAAETVCEDACGDTDEAEAEESSEND